MIAMPSRVLFVCRGNICRSPLAEGVFRQLVSERGLAEFYEVDSAGTAGMHAGEQRVPGAGKDRDRQTGKHAGDKYRRCSNL